MIFSTAWIFSGLLACDTAGNIKDAIMGGEQASYCEALCDWATDCATGHSSLDENTMQQRCLEATRASDEQCALAESGGLGSEEILRLNTCTDAVYDMSCDSLIGAESDVLYGRPPDLACTVAYGGLDEAELTDISNFSTYLTYNEARNSVLTTGDELCDEMASTICGKAVDCLIGDYSIGEAEDVVMASCLATVMGSVTAECKSSGMYNSTLPVDYNVVRYAAEECIDSLDEYGSCEVFTSAPPVTCVAAFADPDTSEDLFMGLIGFAGDYGVSF